MPLLSRKRKRKPNDEVLEEVETGRTVDDSGLSLNINTSNSIINNIIINSSQNTTNGVEEEVELAEVRDDNTSTDWADDSNDTFVEPSFTQIERNLNELNGDHFEKSKLNVAETGSIESITLNNFMCHSNFHLDFGPRINFIVGRNGSGKSAILNAIVIGLGGRATTTNRGKGIASFIKSGESQAKVIIKICNNNKLGFGKVGFNVNEFGKSIIIERTLYSSGSSSYKIKSANGRVIADRKEALDDIMRHFNIQVDNPICVLNQEVSRNFLNTKNPRDKYTFFMKATLLEDMKNDYATSETDRSISAKLLDNKMKIIPETTKDVKTLERKVKMFNDLVNHKERFAKLNNEALWALVNEEKQELKKLEKQISKYKEKIDAEMAKFVEEKEKIAELESDKNEKLRRIENLVQDVENAHQLYDECKKRCDALREDYKKKESDERKIKAELSVIISDKRHLEQKIEDLEQQFSDESHNQRKNEMSKLSENIAKLRDEEQELVNSSHDLRSNQNSLTESRVRLQEENRNFSYVISTKAKDIERLNQSRSERLKRYGNKYPELVKRIEAAHRRGQFKVKPLGPIGNHIELKDYSCALAVELCLKGLIYAFCCDNMADRQVLQSIMKQVFGNERMPSIITRKFGPLHDVRRHKVDGTDYKSLLELMIIKDEPIANCLIDQLRIEQILFIPDYKVAQNLLINRSTAPKNCYQSYTADGCVMYPNTRDSDYKCYANNTNKKRANILMENVDQILDSLHSEINHLKEQKIECEQRLQLNKQQFDANNKELSSFDAKIKQTRQSLIKSDLRLKELEAIGDSPPVEISTLQEELDNHNRRKTQLEQQIENKKEERNVIHNSLDEMEKEMKTKKIDYEKLLNGRHPLKEQLEKIKNEILSRNQVLLKKEKQMNELKALKTEEENKLMFKESELENYERTALEATGEPIQTNRSKKAILNEVKQLQQFLEEQENSIGNRDEIYAKYKELSAHYKRMKSEVDALRNHLRKLKISLDLRRRGYIELRNFYSMMTKFFFLDVLRHKGFCGSLEIYHNEKNINGEIKKAKTLEIRVNPKYDENSGILSNSSSYSDTRSLSGGERSYSTVAFILALWESAQSPFKILDEVDVFMDMVTRKISLDAMIEFASQKSGKQYIFLSPLKLQTLPSPELIKIFQMPEPER